LRAPPWRGTLPPRARLTRIPEARPVRTVIYARFSSQLQNARSIEDQVAMCRERCEREGWPVVEVFVDAAISGAAGIDDARRPGLGAMLAAIETGGIDQVVAESTDRIARHQGDAFAIRDRLSFARCRLFTLMDGEVDDITGTIKGLMDARFRKDLGARVRRGQRGAVSQGRAPAGLAYGYRRANRLDTDGELIRGLREIDEEQAEIVRRIFAEYAAGRSPRAIALSLNADGVPGPRGGQWCGSTISGDRTRGNGMLLNRLYAGELVVGRTSKVTNPRTRRTVIRANGAADRHEHDVPELRIVDQATWAAVQQRFAEGEGVRPELQRRPKHLLSGMGVCGVCGGGWIRTSRDYWSCGRRRDGGGCINTRTIKEKTYTAAVLARLKAQLLDPEAVSLWIRTYHREHARRVGDLTRERAAVERRHAEAQCKVARLVTILAEGGREFAELREVLATARGERDALAAQLASLDVLPQVLTLHPGLADEYRRQVDALDQAVSGDGAETADAATRIRALVARVVLTPRPDARGVEVEVIGRMEEVLRLAGAPLTATG
jgi:site-specific DNA recombinase